MLIYKQPIKISNSCDFRGVYYWNKGDLAKKKPLSLAATRLGEEVLGMVFNGLTLFQSVYFIETLGKYLKM